MDTSTAPCLDNLSKLSKRPPINISFENLSYQVDDREYGYKQILKSINGTFCSGQISAILGASGAGKSTLLNILAGYVSSGVSGTIKVNGAPRHKKIFNKISTYIMQEDLVQPFLTVYESMIVSANLKLGHIFNKNEKHNIIMEILTNLRLNDCLETLSQYLSGGQRKRLSIALELVNNPPVIFLDEPTTGLDDVAVKQCMELLRTLSLQGRTVICTIHTPADSIFRLFDQVYFMADGYCAYNGSSKHLVSHLSSVGFMCPPTYNPADYVLEILHLNKDNVQLLSNNCDNGRLLKKETIGTVEKGATHYLYENSSEILDESQFTFQTTFWTQFYILLCRMFLQIWRNKSVLIMQTIHHIFSAIALGSIFNGIGNDAQMIRSNFNFCLASIVFFVYTYAMVPVLSYPMERKYVKREYFNRWYGLKPYYCALSISSLPPMMLLGTVSIIIIYFITYQPLQLDKFLMFTLMMLLLGISSQALGYIFGTIFNVMNGAAIAPAIVACMMVICIHGIGYGHTLTEMTKTLLYSSYLRFGLIGTVNAIYENRENLQCNELFCPYSNPQIFLNHLGMTGSSYYCQVLGLTFFIILFRLIGFGLLKFNMSTEVSHKYLNYITKMYSRTRLNLFHAINFRE